MKLLDIIVTIICSEAGALVFADFVKEYDQYHILKWVFLFVVPILAIAVFWLADLIQRRFKFVSELIKYLLIGVLAVLVDLKIFALLTWMIGLEIVIVAGLSKAVSFVAAVFVKFIGNKYWTFGDKGAKGIENEIIKFILVTFVGLLIDVGAFYYFSKVMGPQFSIPSEIWVKISIVLAAVAAAVWNFLSYKFIVFKKVKNNDSTVQEISPTDI